MNDASELDKLTELLMTRGSELHKQYEAVDQMYFMTEGSVSQPSKPRPQEDPKDVKMTISPAVRNSVVGLVRLLTTNEPRFKPTGRTAKLAEIEELCKIMWLVSCQAKRAELHVDAVRSAALYSDTHLKAECVDDLIEDASDDEKDRLTELRKRTPYLFEMMSPHEDYPYIGRYGMRGMLRRYEMTGDDIKATWRDADPSLFADATPYYIRDWWDMTHHRAWPEGHSSQPLQEGAHGLKQLLMSVQLADGSELWRDEHKQRQPFLYAMYKGGIWRRQNALLTEIFTAINERGTGILLGFEGEPSEVVVNFAGPGVRWLSAPKAKVLSESAFDPSLITIMQQILQPLTEQSTIFPQTLGSPQDMGQAPFSAIAMLSQAGQLPTVPVKKAVTNVIKDVMMAVLRKIKADGEELKGIVEMTADEIPDDLDLEVTLEIKLPQDMFRNVQIAQTAVEKGMATRAWVQENLMQIGDPKAMMKAVWKEKAADTMFNNLLTNYINKLNTPPAPPTPTTPLGGENAMAGGNAAQTTPPEAASPEGGPVPPMPATGSVEPAGGVMTPGGPQAAQAGGGAVEASQPMGQTMRRGMRGRRG